uniref:BHLH domain-containing protein n=1 Tax=Glossina austeni TaxID=7395 RepID=A0A1A9ULJ8_GLOAU
MLDCNEILYRAKRIERVTSKLKLSRKIDISQEEIDVVSINDKKLPTNPSDKDRRALQNKVAHKFNARIIKNANGLRTIPPRRRGSYEFPYTPASSSPVKSVNNSRYPSPASTPYQSQYTTNGVGVGVGVGVGAATILKRHCSLDESADTIEKRHLHNDMERQRRIGLKNLFEALKKQIPSIKDKERAPKHA